MGTAISQITTFFVDRNQISKKYNFSTGGVYKDDSFLGSFLIYQAFRENLEFLLLKKWNTFENRIFTFKIIFFVNKKIFVFQTSKLFSKIEIFGSKTIYEKNTGSLILNKKNRFWKKISIFFFAKKLILNSIFDISRKIFLKTITNVKKINIRILYIFYLIFSNFHIPPQHNIFCVFFSFRFLFFLILYIFFCKFELKLFPNQKG